MIIPLDLTPETKRDMWLMRYIDLAWDFYIHNRVTHKASLMYAAGWMELIYGPCPGGLPEEASRNFPTRREDRDPYPEE